ncbi:hypothetical protein BH09PLA1_BH09PLA1_37340 [soil metagenome]
MRRLRRIAFSSVAALSAVIFFAAVLLWCWSQHRSHWVGIRVGRLSVIANNWRSYAGLDVRRLNSHWTTTGELQRFEIDTYPPATSSPLWFVPRYHHRTFSGQLERDIWDVRIPYWLILLATGVMPVNWFRSTRTRKRRARLGQCAACGYDLRATPERCPECGTEPMQNAE